MLRSRGTSGDHSVQPITQSRDSCNVRVGCFGLFQSSQVLKMCKDEDCTTSLDNLIHCLTALMVEKHVSLSSLNHYRFNLCPLSHSPGMQRCQKPASIFLMTCLYCKAAIRCPSAPSLLVSRLNKIHSLSPSSQGKCSRTLTVLVKLQNLFQFIDVFLTPVGSKLDTTFKVQSNECQVEGDNNFSQSTIHTPINTWYSWSAWLSVHTDIELAAYKDSEGLSSEVAPQPEHPHFCCKWFLLPRCRTC